MKNYDDETLMAFADGQLDEPDFSELAAAIEAEPALAQRLELLVLGKDLAKAVYAPLIDRAVPAQLTQAVKAAAANAGGTPNVVPFRKRGFARSELAGLAMAACLGAIVAGPAGYLLRQAPAGDGLSVGAPLSSELASLLASLPSGGEQRLGDGSIMRPIATFRDTSGALCREFEVDATSSSVAVACRPTGEWRVAFALDTPATAEGYAPAAALDALDTYLQSIGAGAPFSPEDEADALSE